MTLRRVRLIARLDIKAPNVIKGIQMDGLRVVGSPQALGEKYYSAGIDELLYVDVVASLYGRSPLVDLLAHASQRIFVPLTVAGGVRSVEDARALLRAGADKVAVNSAAIREPKLLSLLAQEFGSQCVVASIEAKRSAEYGWEAFVDGGRERTGLSAVEWARKAESLGAGEVLITSVDQDGTKKGFDLDLVEEVSKATSLPVVASGGLGSDEDALLVATKTDVAGIASARALHDESTSVDSIRRRLLQDGVNVRSIQ